MYWPHLYINLSIVCRVISPMGRCRLQSVVDLRPPSSVHLSPTLVLVESSDDLNAFLKERSRKPTPTIDLLFVCLVFNGTSTKNRSPNRNGES